MDTNTRIENNAWDKENVSGYIGDECVMLAQRGTLHRGISGGGAKASWSLWDYRTKRAIYTRPGCSKSEVIAIMRRNFTK